MGELSRLPNIGKIVEAQLEEAGISTVDELRRVGSRAAWERILTIDPSACYNRLCGLEGALRGIRWHALPPEVKADLKAFYNEKKKAAD